MLRKQHLEIIIQPLKLLVCMKRGNEQLENEMKIQQIDLRLK